MKKIFTVLILFFSIFLFCQKSVEDSIVIKVCNDLPNYKNLADKDKIKTVFKLHLFEYMQKQEPGKRDSIFSSLEARLQRRCNEYMDIRDRISNHKTGNWDFLEKIPESKVSDDEINEFKKTQNFYYIQKDGSKVNVIIKDSLWTDLFSNNTFSKLKFEWLTKNSFQIEFIESNNVGRKGASRRGDKFVYNIIEKNNDSYKLVLTTSQNNRIVSFSFYTRGE